ncbi:MAG: twin-arginine translocation signal domain-containing protein, partial [bacterium]
MKEISDHTDKSSRRTFLKSTGAAAAGLAVTGYTASAKDMVAAASSSTESLALDGGPKSVTFPKDRIAAATKW